MSVTSITSQPLMLNTMNRMREEAAGQSEIIRGPASGDFTSVMRAAINSIDQQQHAASQKMTAVEIGKSDDLVGAMVASQKAGLSFSALVQVRNRLVSGFDEIMRMPV